jgi:uncharacterized protein YdaU (DUF1376 family)
MRRRLYQLPVEGLLDNPQALTLPAAGFGMLCRLLLHFHATDCAPLPIQDHELRSIARGHAPTWRHWKPTILAIFEAIRPEIETYHHNRATRQDALRIGRARSSAVRTQARIAAQQPDTAASAPTFHSLAILPHREPTPPVQRPPAPDNRPPRRVMTDRTRQ